jgi:dsDNA-binding SOS-regulon protein
MKIKRVASYETTDGQIFTDKKDAQAHQKELDRIDALVVLVDEKVRPYGALTDTGETAREHLIEITFGELAQFVTHNADAIRALLPQRAAKTIADEPTLPGSGEVPEQAAGIQVEELAES